MVNSTNSINLDRILVGKNGQIIELSGQTGTGKTQIAHLLAVSTAMKNDGFVVYIDSGGNFAPTRIVQLCKPFTASEIVVKDILRRIIWIQCFQARDLELALRELDDGMGLNIDLIIIDSIRSIVGPNLMMTIGKCDMKQIAIKLNIPMLITNELKQYVPNCGDWNPNQKIRLKLALSTQLRRESILSGQNFDSDAPVLVNIEIVGQQQYNDVQIGRFSIDQV